MASQASKLSVAPQYDGTAAFAWQYTSLMIMILAFVIGAFTGKPKDKDSKTLAPQAPIESVKTNQFMDPATLKRDQGFFAKDLFIIGEARVNSDKLEALRSVLMNHDLTLEVDLFGDNCDPEASEGCRKLLFARAETLLESFAALEVPADSVAIYVVSKSSEAQARVSYYEDGA